MPCSIASRGLDEANGLPCQRISPRSALTSPARIFSSVDLPAPFSPTSACASPSATSKLTPRRAVHGAERFVDALEAEAHATEILVER